MLYLSSFLKLHALVARLLVANAFLCFNSSHVIPIAAFVIDKNLVILLPVKIFLDVICWINNTDYLCFLKYFHSPAVLSCEPVVADSGQTECETAETLLL